MSSLVYYYVLIQGLYNPASDWIYSSTVGGPGRASSRLPSERCDPARARGGALPVIMSIIRSSRNPRQPLSARYKLIQKKQEKWGVGQTKGCIGPDHGGYGRVGFQCIFLCSAQLQPRASGRTTGPQVLDGGGFRVCTRAPCAACHLHRQYSRTMARRAQGSISHTYGMIGMPGHPMLRAGLRCVPRFPRKSPVAHKSMTTCTATLVRHVAGTHVSTTPAGV